MYEIEVEVTVDTEAGVDVGIDLTPEGIFAGATAALEALDSYRFTTSFLFTGEEDGEVESGSIELSGEIMDAQRKHFVWRNVADDEHIELIQLGDQAWIHDEEDWESVPVLVAESMSQVVLVFAPAGCGSQSDQALFQLPHQDSQLFLLVGSPVVRLCLRQQPLPHRNVRFDLSDYCG